MSGKTARAARRVRETAAEARESAALWRDIATGLQGEDQAWALEMAAAAERYAGFCSDGRISLPALGRHAAAAAQLDARIRELVAALRGLGATWAQIGAEFGITAEGARKRYGGGS